MVDYKRRKLHSLHPNQRGAKSRGRRNDRQLRPVSQTLERRKSYYMNPLPLVDGCLFLDNSTIERITTCPTAANFYYIQKKELDSASAPLRYGGIVHEAMRFRYSDQDNFDEGKQLAFITEQFNSSPLESEGWRNADAASKLIRAYNRQYPEKLPIALLPDGR